MSSSYKAKMHLAGPKTPEREGFRIEPVCGKGQGLWQIEGLGIDPLMFSNMTKDISKVECKDCLKRIK